MDGSTDGRMDGPTDRWTFPPLMLLGQLGGVDLKNLVKIVVFWQLFTQQRQQHIQVCKSTPMVHCCVRNLALIGEGLTARAQNFKFSSQCSILVVFAPRG